VRQAAGEARLDRAARAAEHLGHLGLGQIEEVAAFERQPLLVAQGPEGGEQRVAPLGGESRRLGGWGRTPRGGADRRRLGGRAQRVRQVGAPATGLAAVARLVGDDGEQPRPERRAVAEASEGVERLDEALLGGVLGLGGVAGDQVSGAEGDPLVAANECLVRGDVTVFGASDQGGVLQWAAPPPDGILRYVYSRRRRMVPRWAVSPLPTPPGSAPSGNAVPLRRRAHGDVPSPGAGYPERGTTPAPAA
jgi:hypothetical protein